MSDLQSALLDLDEDVERLSRGICAVGGGLCGYGPISSIQRRSGGRLGVPGAGTKTDPKRSGPML